MLIPITDKDEVKKLELNTTPLQNITEINRIYFKEYMDVISWYLNHDDIDADSSIYKKWEKLEKQLGCKPISYPTYSHRNALWAFKWKNNDVLIYYDIRGMKIQVNENFSKKEIKSFLNYLNSILTIKF
jgi:hypothetical protein